MSKKVVKAKKVVIDPDEVSFDDIVRLILQKLPANEKGNYALEYLEGNLTFSVLKKKAESLGFVFESAPIPVQVKPSRAVGDILRRGRETVIISDIEWNKGADPDDCYYDTIDFKGNQIYSNESFNIDDLDDNKKWKLIGNVYKLK